MRYPRFLPRRRDSSASPGGGTAATRRSTWWTRPFVSVWSRGAELADEVEAWVNGDLATLRSGRHGMAPWILLNRLAHADEPVLRGLLDSGDLAEVDPVVVEPEWAVAERELARLLLRAGASAADVAAVQRDVLVPLEMRLIEDARKEPMSLDDVAAVAGRALGQRSGGG